MQMRKILEAAWEPSPPWKLSGSAFLVSGHQVESFLEIKWPRGESLAKDLSTSARTAVLAIIHTVAGLLVPWIEDQPRLYTYSINSTRQKGIVPSLQRRLRISTPAPWTCALMVQRGIAFCSSGKTEVSTDKLAGQ